MFCPSCFKRVEIERIKIVFENYKDQRGEKLIRIKSQGCL